MEARSSLLLASRTSPPQAAFPWPVRTAPVGHCFLPARRRAYGQAYGKSRTPLHWEGWVTPCLGVWRQTSLSDCLLEVPVSACLPCPRGSSMTSWSFSSTSISGSCSGRKDLETSARFGCSTQMLGTGLTLSLCWVFWVPALPQAHRLWCTRYRGGSWKDVAASVFAVRADGMAGVCWRALLSHLHCKRGCLGVPSTPRACGRE